MVACATLVLVVASCAAAEHAPQTRTRKAMDAYSGKATVIDGDGLEIAGTKIRLFGVDAPEVGQFCKHTDGTRWHCGQYATVALDKLAGGKQVSCAARAKDRYGRAVAVCTLDGRDLAGEMARAGWVFAYRHFSSDYVDEEDQAKAARAGVWSGDVEAPWDWRARTRDRH